MDGTSDQPIGFGYKCAWLALRTDDPSSVAAALFPERPSRCDWRSGYRSIYGRDRGLAFLTPSIQGWVLAAAWDLPTFNGPKVPDKLTPLLDRLVATFPEVQHFATHRVVGYQSWSRLIGGQLVRSFTYSGERSEILRDVGEADECERRLIDAHQATWRPSDSSPTYQFRPSEDHVIAMASAWSIDPTGLHKMGLPPSSGLLGRLAGGQ